MKTPQVLPKPIWVVNFDNASLQNFTTQFMEAEQNEGVDMIVVMISSYGGSAHNMLAMRDLIKSSEKKVATVGYGKAMSAGSLLLAAGTKGFRFSTPNTQIMVHEVQTGVTGNLTEVKEAVVITQQLDDNVFKLLAEDTGKPVKFWKDKLKKIPGGDLYVSSDEAKRLGLIDQVGTPRLVMFEQSASALSVADLKPKR
jgi:ATP-dependent Clp protease, protease subunit